MFKIFPSLLKCYDYKHVEHHGKDDTDRGFSIVSSAVAALSKTTQGFMGNLKTDLENLKTHIKATQEARLLQGKSPIEVIIVPWNRKTLFPKKKQVLVGFDLPISYARGSQKVGSDVEFFDLVYGDREEKIEMPHVTCASEPRPKLGQAIKNALKYEEPLIAPTTEFSRDVKREKLLENPKDSRPPKRKKSQARAGKVKKRRVWDRKEVIATVQRISGNSKFFPLSSRFVGSDYQAWQILRKGRLNTGEPISVQEVAKNLNLNLSGTFAFSKQKSKAIRKKKLVRPSH